MHLQVLYPFTELRYKSEVVAIQVNYSVGQSLFQDIQETIGSYEIGILGTIGGS